VIQKCNVLLATLFTMLTLTACSFGGKTSPSIFHVLSASSAESMNDGPPMSVLLGPLSLPDVVLRPQIVTRPEQGRMVFAEYHRWAGDLRANVEQVLLQNLSYRLGNGAVIPVGSGDSDVDYRVAIRFLRFDGVPGSQVVLEGNWRVKTGAPGCLAGMHRFSIEVPVAGKEYGAYVRGLDKGLAQLGDSIARNLVQRPGCLAVAN